MIAIFAAMESEVQPVLSGATAGQTEDVAGFAVTHVSYYGLDAIVCRTGIGKCAADATAAVLDRYRARAVLSVGTAGGLAPALRVGDILLCDPVSVSASSGYGDEDGSITADQNLMVLAQAAAQDSGLAISIGRSLTVQPAVASADEKRRVRELTGHDVVEMESYWVGKVAVERGIPFLTVRVVSDDSDDAIIIDAGFVRTDGTLDYSRLAEWAQQNPDQVGLLRRMGERSRIGTASLARFAETFLKPSVWARFGDRVSP